MTEAKVLDENGDPRQITVFAPVIVDGERLGFIVVDKIMDTGFARFARRIFVGFEGARGALAAKVGEERIRVAGVPLRKGLVAEFRERRSRELRAESTGAAAEPVHLFVFGGSQGARQINEALIEALPRLDAARLRIELERTEVRAPFSGVISGLELDQGENVQVGQTVCRLVDDIMMDGEHRRPR